LGRTAEFRGPGIHHYNDEDDYEMDMDQRTRHYGSKSGRIILLGDGTEVLTDSANEDMLDHDEDDEKSTGDEHERSNREGTPGPTDSDSSDDSTKTNESNHAEGPTPDEPKMGAVAEKADPTAKAA